MHPQAPTRSGNVLTNDTDIDTGDTKTSSGVAAGTVGSASTNVGSGVTGSYGSINIAADGTYTYAVNNSNASVQALRTTGDTLLDVFTYTMTDAAGVTSTTQLTVTIQGANDSPTDITATALSIAENSANGTSVGTAHWRRISTRVKRLVTASPTMRADVLRSTAVLARSLSPTPRYSTTKPPLRTRSPFASTDAGGLSYDKLFSVDRY